MIKESSRAAKQGIPYCDCDFALFSIFLQGQKTWFLGLCFL
ncbi:hypothetical protein CHCC5023_2248 [Bacillus paralicheniformis]|nr:hypothetical protein CHCC5023_2248 [Bacillus paralicheniformis]TWJ71326.1 hypothetical protein CHCC5019_0130 [Bacillus paralicheniformis]